MKLQPIDIQALINQNRECIREYIETCKRASLARASHEPKVKVMAPNGSQFNVIDTQFKTMPVRTLSMSVDCLGDVSIWSKSGRLIDRFNLTRENEAVRLSRFKVRS